MSVNELYLEKYTSLKNEIKILENAYYSTLESEYDFNRDDVLNILDKRIKETRAELNKISKLAWGR